MKYIRTKEGLFEVEDEILAPNGEDEPSELWFKVVGKAELINSIRVINQADTIKELCDVYVIVGEDKDTNGNPILWSIRQDIPFFMKYYFNYNDIYAAIWTKWGLKYVAKMDSEGKLVLI